MMALNLEKMVQKRLGEGLAHTQQQELLAAEKAPLTHLTT